MEKEDGDAGEWNLAQGVTGRDEGRWVFVSVCPRWLSVPVLLA